MHASHKGSTKGAMRGGRHPESRTHPHLLHQSHHGINGRPFPCNTHSVMNNYARARKGQRDLHHDFDRHVGAEPGVNPRSGRSIAEYGHFQQECAIEVIDYDSESITFQKMTNAEFVSFLKEGKSSQESLEGSSGGHGGHGGGSGYDDLPPKSVRWINVGGVDWTVLSSLALRYRLHALSLEDILHERGHNQSKADYYPGHLFIRVLCHSLVLEDHDVPSSNPPAWRQPPEEDDSDDEEVRPYRDQPTLAATSSARSNDAERGDLKARASSRLYPNPVDRAHRSTSGDRRESNVPEGISSEGGSRLKLFRASFRKRFGALSGFQTKARKKQIEDLEAAKGDKLVHVTLEPLFIYLLNDGTVISIHPSPNLNYTAPITERLHVQESVLRASDDATLLVESLLDLVVDRVLEMVDEYQVNLHNLEHEILRKPHMTSVRHLHIMSGELTMLQRTLDPIKTMIFGLRNYDLDRVVALADSMAADPSYDSDSETVVSSPGNDGKPKSREVQEAAKQQGKEHRRKMKRIHQQEKARMHAFRHHLRTGSGGLGGGATGLNSPQLSSAVPKLGTSRRNVAPTEGYFSFKSKVYLADVYDHIDFAISSLEMFVGISENLIDYAFNMASYEMNKTMKRLTLATIIFLPLTLLTGYFGMNFSSFRSVHEHSELFFWIVAIPVTIALIPIFMWSDVWEWIKRVRDGRGRRTSLGVVRQ